MYIAFLYLIIKTLLKSYIMNLELSEFIELELHYLRQNSENEMLISQIISRVGI